MKTDDKLIEKAASEMAVNSWKMLQVFIADMEECIEAAKALSKCRLIVDYPAFIHACNNTTKRITGVCNGFDNGLVKIRENAFYKARGDKEQ